MIINADLHVHSKYSMATSKNMIPQIMSTESIKKGLNLIATGDALHSKWLNELEQSLTQIDDKGIYQYKDYETKFITTTEVEDSQRIHHLLIIPSLEVAWQMRDEFIAKNMDADGRPKLRMQAPEIMDIAHEYGCIIGPAHIFTPWTGIYKSYDSIKDCYKSKPDFVELGLSSDTHLAEGIDELDDYTFLTNSDSHSPWPHRIGREFNQIEVSEVSFNEVKKSILDNKIVKNYGINPRLGKYHKTGCIKCYKEYSIDDAIESGMQCECGGRIKKGVITRIEELQSPKTSQDSTHPPYQYVMPLAQLISTVHSKGITTKYVQTRYDNLISEYGNEISVLLDVPFESLNVVDSPLAKLIDDFRNDRLKIVSGRGGRYGEILS